MGKEEEAWWPPGATAEKPKKKSNGEAPREKRPVPKGESAFDLTERNVPKPIRLCDPWATEGVNIIAGRPKLGKTTLERQKMAAAAIGGPYLDSNFPEPVKCAFLSLEEGESLCREKFIRAGFTETALACIQLHFEWPRGFEAVDLLDRYLSENPEIRLVCIDSLTKFRDIPDPKTPAFMADYYAINALHEMAKKHKGKCIDLIHHTRKAKSDDPIDDVSGTYGLTAAADSFVVLRALGKGVVMHIASRLWDREDNQYTLQRAANHTWEMLGVHLDITDKQKEAYEMVKASPDGMSGKELSDRVSITIPSAWQRLDELIEKGLVTKKYGRVYVK